MHHHISDKGLISSIYKEHPQHNNKQTAQLKDGKKEFECHFLKENIQRVDRHMKRCLTFLVFRKMQSKTAARPLGHEDGYCQSPRK